MIPIKFPKVREINNEDRKIIPEINIIINREKVIMLCSCSNSLRLRLIRLENP